MPITTEEVNQAIKKLNNGKAADGHGVQAEHIKKAGSILFGPLAHLFNLIIARRKVPADFKKGVVIPIPKKDKNCLLQENYRGITLTSTVGKVFENVLLERLGSTLDKQTCQLQRGFTAKTSSLSAALIVSELENEAKDNKKELFIATLDARKAFDVVCHASLLRKLHLQQIDKDIWCIIKDWYDGATSQVKWKGVLSEPFDLYQGVHQGRVTSTELYKCYIDPLLHRLEEKKYGTRIGHLYVGAPTCADDVLLGSNNMIELQDMLDEACIYSQKERYILHPQKSAVILVRSKHPLSFWKDISPWSLNDEEVQVVDSGKHLGVERNNQSTNKVVIQERTMIGRRTTYALMGAGLHGLNGINPKVAHKLIQTYVEPRYLYGMEILNLSETELKTLDSYQRKILKQIQHLPEKTANGAVYLLLGALPVRARIEINQLTLFLMTITGSSLESKIAERQLAMKDLNSKSWFMGVCRKLHKYNLPSAHDLLFNPPPKDVWKNQINTVVQEYWNEELRNDAASKSSLKYLNINACKIGTVHPTWDTVESNQRDVYRATIKTKLLTGTYNLQGNRAKFNQFNIDPTCLLCDGDPETREHFLVCCPKLQQQREPFLKQLEAECENMYPGSWANIAISPTSLTQLILDPTHFTCYPNLHVHTEPISRMLTYRLHVTRTAIIASLTKT